MSNQQCKITNSCQIPSRRIVINDDAQLPVDYSSTPGGTIFSTTPGGTRIVYDRALLMQLRNSPIAKTPPKNLPNIPGVTLSPVDRENSKQNGPTPCIPRTIEKSENAEEPQFSMDE
ncbi:eukaryotic translation initiation factor 4E-binding protein 1 [Centruroides vittatus]|uniref:eukaryotic translation initiation factor 4E-binding protein 1 n=1 Tax=Centruroides vittatus TaxID=120091 RepID=UPI00350FF85D